MYLSRRNNKRMEIEELELRRLLAAEGLDLNHDSYSTYLNSDTIELEVMTNDTFADDYVGPREITAVSFGSRGGRISVAQSGTSLLYRPPADFVGREEFNYFVGDESARVRLDIKSPLKNDRFSIAPDNMAHSLDVLKNDPFWDEYAGARLITSVSTSSSGSDVQIAPDRQSLVYTPDYVASGHHDQIVYIVDGKFSAQIEVRLRHATREDHFELLSVDEAQELNVLRNDRFWPEYEGPKKITHIIHEAGYESKVSVSEDGSSLLYTPPTDEHAYDHFRYVVDGKFETWVNVNVPRPVHDDYFDVEANSENVRLNVLNNDRYWSSIRNREVDAITSVTSVSETSNGGTIELETDGRYLRYTPPENFVGEDEFSYIADSHYEAHVRVKVEPPVNDDHLSVYQGTPQTLRVLRNDFPDDGHVGDRIITAIDDEDRNATIHVSDGVILYQSDADFVGQDEFTYTVDGEFEATVYVDVQPLAQGDYFDLCPTADNTHTLRVLRNDKFRRDYEGPGQIDHVEILDGDGSVSISEDGTELNFSAGLQDYSRLSYTVDGLFQGDVTTHRFNWLNSDRITVDQNSPATSINLLANDFVDQSYHTCRASRYAGDRRISSISESKHGGLVEILEDGRSVKYAPPRDFVGTDEFTYIVDGTLQQTVYVEVVRYVQDDRVLVLPGTSERLFVQANDVFGTSYLGARLITNVSSSRLGATVEVGEDGRSIVYSAPPSADGQETLTYTIDDQLTARVEVTIHQPGDDLFPQFSSLEEYQKLLISNAVSQHQSQFGEPKYDYSFDGWFRGDYGGGAGGAFGCSSCALGGSNLDPGAPSHSDTNVQVEGIDEADIVEFDADFVYFLTGRDLVILDAWPAEELHEVSRVEIEGHPVAQFLDEDRLTVISEYYDDQRANLLKRSLGVSEGSLLDDARRSSPQGTIVTVLDVSDRSNPGLVQRTTMQGRYLQARSLDEHVYIVLDTPTPTPGPIALPGENPEPEDGWREFQGVYETESQFLDRLRSNIGDVVQTSLPSFYSEGPNAEIVRSGLLHEPEDIIKPTGDQLGSLLSLVSINTHNAEPGLTSASGIFADGEVTVYASLEHFYVFQPDYSDGAATTNILQFDWNHDTGDIKASSTGYVPGTMLNQFSADEFEDHLRIVTTVRNPTSGLTETNLFVLQNEEGVLEHTGSLQSIGVGESAQSVRFMGPKAFVVTFERVDPLFGLDVSDPTNPRELGHLTIAGFSTYMQLIDENHLLGVGRNTPNGFSGPAQISLLDVSDLSNPTLVDEFTMERFSTSEAGFDHHAFGYFSEHGVLAVPTSRSFHDRSDEDADGYAETRTWTSEHELMVFRIDTETEVGADQAVQHAATLTHDSQVRRSGYIGDFLYSIAEDSIQAVHVDTPEVVVAHVEDLRREAEIYDEETPVPLGFPNLPDLVTSARQDLAERLSLTSGNAVSVVAELSPDGWQAVLRVDNAYFRYGAEKGALELLGPGYDFKPVGSEVSWVNVDNPADVDGDGTVTPGDAIAVIDFLAGRDSVSLATESVLRQVVIQDEVSRGFWDVNGDYVVSPSDVALITEKISSVPTAGNPVEIAKPTSFDDKVALDAYYARIRAAAGDANGDQSIDFADFLILSEHFGRSDSSYSEGDVDGSGIVDFVDFLILASNQT